MPPAAGLVLLVCVVGAVAASAAAVDGTPDVAARNVRVSFAADAPDAAVAADPNRWDPNASDMDADRAALLATVECDWNESFEFIHANMTCGRSVPYWLDTYYWAYVMILTIGCVPVLPAAKETLLGRSTFLFVRMC